MTLELRTDQAKIIGRNLVIPLDVASPSQEYNPRTRGAGCDSSTKCCWLIVAAIAGAVLLGYGLTSKKSGAKNLVITGSILLGGSIFSCAVLICQGISSTRRQTGPLHRDVTSLTSIDAPSPSTPLLESVEVPPDMTGG